MTCAGASFVPVDVVYRASDDGVPTRSATPRVTASVTPTAERDAGRRDGERRVPAK